MRNRVIWIMMLLVLTLLTRTALAQEGGIPVYTCSDGNGCAETSSSGQISASEAEIVIGEAQPSPDHYIVCDVDCSWTNLDPADADIVYGGDGIPWQQGDDIDLGPFDPESPIKAGEGELPIVLNPDLDRPYIVTCVGNDCTIRRANITFDEAVIVFGEPSTGDSPYILCTDICQWWSGPLPLFEAAWIPESGAWDAIVGISATQNCSVDVGPDTLDQILREGLRDNLPGVQSGSVQLTFSEPLIAQDFFPDTTSISGMTYRKTGLNSYRALLDRSTDDTVALVIYTFTVESPTRLSGSLRLTIRNAAIGCTVITPLEYTFAG